MRVTTLALLLCAVFGVQGHSQTVASQIAVINVNVIDVDAGTVRSNMMVLFEGDRIARVEPYREASVPSAAQVIRADGKFLIPGLWDMHVHSYEEPELALFVANGVTGIRQMSGRKTHHDRATRIANGDLIGPRQVIGSNIIDGPTPIWGGSLPVRNESDAGPTVERAVRDGAQFIKVYSLLPRDAYFAIAAKSKQLGVPFVGHVPFTVNLAEASSAGQASVEHMSDILFAASNREEEFRRELNAAAKEDYADANIRPVFRKQAAALFESYDATKAERLFETLARNRTAVVPTLVAERGMAFVDDAGFTNDPRLKYAPRRLQQEWDPTRDFRLKQRTPEQWAHEKVVFRRKVGVAGDLQRKGVLLLAGTDMGTPFCFPGFSLHDELALLVEAGLSPADALRTATINPARFLGRQSSAGTIAEGKIADAVLLEANPLMDIRNTTEISGVISGGRYFDRVALDRVLKVVEEAANLISIGETLAPIIRARGGAAAVAEYERLKESESSKYDFAEEELDFLGYELLRDRLIDEAIEMFKLNVRVYPTQSNPYDSLGDAYAAKGLTELAIQNYERSLELDPTNTHAVQQLRKLRETR